MALINCPECKKLISNKAKMCPQCGYDVSKYNKKVWIRRNKRKMFTYVMLLVVICGCLIGGYYVYERCEKQENLRKEKVYNSLTEKYYKVRSAVNVLEKEKNKIENNESKVSKNVDIMFSQANNTSHIIVLMV